MAYQAIFQRYELKYLLTRQQEQQLLRLMQAHMVPDQYGQVTVRSLYFDTDNYRLIRQSIEKPVYKEKLRLRSYRRAAEEEEVFVELKKKYRSVVYKRRLLCRQSTALQWLTGEIPCPLEGQIPRETEYFRRFYQPLQPKLYLSCRRIAYCEKNGGDFRVTFDRDILCRQEELTLDSEPRGTDILSPEQVLLELKCSGGIPLWMSEALSRLGLRRTPFSKYGTAYRQLILPRFEGGFYHV